MNRKDFHQSLQILSKIFALTGVSDFFGRNSRCPASRCSLFSWFYKKPAVIRICWVFPNWTSALRGQRKSFPVVSNHQCGSDFVSVSKAWGRRSVVDTSSTVKVWVYTRLLFTKKFSSKTHWTILFCKFSSCLETYIESPKQQLA